MKLSRALLIVLVLHVVAVAGIIAFNAIKTRQGGLPPPPLAKSANAKTEDASAQSSAVETQKPTMSADRGEEQPKHSAVAKEEPKTEKAKHTPKSSVTDSGRPMSSRKATIRSQSRANSKSPTTSLIALNHIDDPNKLQIGQKLSIPAKPAKSKKSDE